MNAPFVKDHYFHIFSQLLFSAGKKSNFLQENMMLK